MEHKIYGVEELTRYIKEVLSGDPTLKDLWVTGEISNFHHHNSGHMYFTLKDDSSRLDAVMFKGHNSNLKFAPEDGLQVTARGYIDVYVPRGEYQFYVQQMEPEGKGALYLAYQQLKEELEEEGLFAEEEKQPIPALPTRIGVVTSPTGAAIRDILSVVERRFKNTSVLIVPSRVQGTGAADEIVAGLNYLNEKENVDLIIVSRGGGSIEDLWPFNEEKVARAIYSSSLPVISGVGHETDFTIADFVADLRAPTPSAAAEVAVSDFLELERNMDNLSQRLTGSFAGVLENYREKINSIAGRQIFQRPESLFADYVQQIDSLSQQLGWGMDKVFTGARRQCELLGGKLDTLSPLKTLSRGYSICTTEQGVTVKSIEQTREGETIYNRLLDGTIISEVQNIEEKNEQVGEKND